MHDFKSDQKFENYTCPRANFLQNLSAVVVKAPLE